MTQIDYVRAIYCNIVSKLLFFNYFVERSTMTKSKTVLVISMSESDNEPAIFLPQVRMETVLVLV